MLIFDYNFLDFFILFLMFISGMMVFCSMRSHLLLSLLSLEYLVLCIYMMMIMYMYMYKGDMYLILIFLTFSVCEGVLGLSILVNFIRCHGNDQVNSLFMMKW
uniref:NADH dehydrogenase subunit 4L n=1 Tax=Cyrtorhinus lividipennis TaxID=1032904 RepID=UPI002114FC2A|nr:NADH dehydrogenase subunit 4L [Cyrtorhinus lividipennis]USH90825.1 NADH dehydrogenase subunit 4L [Cyrtorhinus lividipennis]